MCSNKMRTSYFWVCLYVCIYACLYIFLFASFFSCFVLLLVPSCVFLLLPFSFAFGPFLLPVSFVVSRLCLFLLFFLRLVLPFHFISFSSLCLRFLCSSSSCLVSCSPFFSLLLLFLSFRVPLPQRLLVGDSEMFHPGRILLYPSLKIVLVIR